jgi:hypothetical protein
VSLRTYLSDLFEFGHYNLRQEFLGGIKQIAKNLFTVASSQLAYETKEMHFFQPRGEVSGTHRRGSNSKQFKIDYPREILQNYKPFWGYECISENSLKISL